MTDKDLTLEKLSGLLSRYEYVRLEECSCDGKSIGKTVPRRHFENFCKRGLNMFSGAPYMLPNSSPSPCVLNDFLRFGFPDGYLFPDLNTLTVIPWEPRTLRVICTSWWFGDPTADSKKLEIRPSPRQVCSRLVDLLKVEFGYELLGAFEFEFQCLVNETLKPAWDGIDVFVTFKNHLHAEFIEYCEAVFSAMRSPGSDENFSGERLLDMNTHNVEFAPGQNEWTFKPRFGITCADSAFTFKNALKELARIKKDWTVTFLTKSRGITKAPGAQGAANGGHFNHSLWKTGKKGPSENVFHSSTHPSGMSDVMRWWIGGLCKHAEALTAFCCPTVVCYERLKKYSWAPCNVSWGVQNRSAMLRAKVDHFRQPDGAPGASSEHSAECVCDSLVTGNGTYLENRLCGAAVNPYLAQAATMAAGLDGLRRKIEPPAENRGNAYECTSSPPLLPNLKEAIDALQKDEEICKLMGETFVRWYRETKGGEVDTFDVTKFADGGVDDPKYDELCRDFYLRYV